MGGLPGGQEGFGLSWCVCVWVCALCGWLVGYGMVLVIAWEGRILCWGWLSGVPRARVTVVKILQVFDYCCPLEVEVSDSGGSPHHRLGSAGSQWATEV